LNEVSTQSDGHGKNSNLNLSIAEVPSNIDVRHVESLVCIKSSAEDEEMNISTDSLEKLSISGINSQDCDDHDAESLIKIHEGILYYFEFDTLRLFR
jgi:hypothetical protein